MQLRTNIAKALVITASAVLLICAFIFDIVERSIGSYGGWLTYLREIIVLAAFILFYLFIESLWKRDQGPAKKLGFALVLSLVVMAGAVMLSFVPSSGFEAKNFILSPLDFDAIVWANVFSIVIGTTSVIILMLIRDIIFSKRRKGTRRNFLVFLALALALTLYTPTMRPLESDIMKTLLIALAIAAMVMNSFRLSWIVYLTKRE